MPSSQQRSQIYLSRRIDALRKELEDIDSPEAKQVEILKLINTVTGSFFSAFNLTDDLARVYGGIAYPLTEQRISFIQELTPTLRSIITADLMQDLMFGGLEHNQAYQPPQSLYLSSPVYQEIYSHFDMHHTAWYRYPRFTDRRRVIVGISSNERAFSRKELSNLEKICFAFRKQITDIADSGVSYPTFALQSDHTTILNSHLNPKHISAYMHAQLSFFYGRLQGSDSEGWQLPADLVKTITHYLNRKVEYIIPLEEGMYFSFNKRRQGRMLSLIVRSIANESYELACYEDQSELERLTRIRKACEDLPRDRYSILSACQAILDGAKGQEQILEKACLSALKPATGRKIVSKAHGILQLVP